MYTSSLYKEFLRTISFPWHQNAFGGVSSGGLSVAELQEGVVRLCSIKSWQGIARASELLGAAFQKEIHNDKAKDFPPLLRNIIKYIIIL